MTITKQGRTMTGHWSHKYTVFVRGAEVNDHLLTWGEAVLLCQSYYDDYDDIAIADMNTNERIEYKE